MNEQNNLQPNEPTQDSKNIWTIVVSVVITALIAGGGVYYWQEDVLKQTKQSFQEKIISLQEQGTQLQTEKEIAERENRNLQKPTQGSEDFSITDWVLFDSQKDAGIKIGFKLKHPENWFQIGSIDGGSASYIPFYDKDVFPETWKAVQQGVKKHPEGGSPVASILVSGPSMIPGEIKYNNESKVDIIIDGYRGTKFNGINSETGTEEVKVVLPNVQNDIFGTVRFEFTIITESEETYDILSKIIKTIQFE